MNKETTKKIVNAAVDNGQITWKDWSRELGKFKEGVDIHNLKDFIKLLWKGPERKK